MSYSTLDTRFKSHFFDLTFNPGTPLGESKPPVFPLPAGHATWLLLFKEDDLSTFVSGTTRYTHALSWDAASAGTGITPNAIGYTPKKLSFGSYVETGDNVKLRNNTEISWTNTGGTSWPVIKMIGLFMVNTSTSPNDVWGVTNSGAPVIRRAVNIPAILPGDKLKILTDRLELDW